MRRTDLPDLRHCLLQWYASHHRDLPWRRTDDPYAIWVSEVMLQQTQVATVVGYYDRFMGLFPDVRRLAGADLDQVLKAWEGLGYYSRARCLHRAAQAVDAHHEGQIPGDPHDFGRLPGVGPYIRAAVGSMAFGHPLAVVDGNVKRVLSRLVCSRIPVNDSAAHRAYQLLADRLLDRRCPGTFNQALMELGALVCKPKGPLCPACPIRRWCRAFDRGDTADFPRRRRKPAVPVHHLAAAVIYQNGKILVVRRPPQRMLGGMWEFPSGSIHAGEDQACACVRIAAQTTGLTIAVTRALVPVCHAYTHLKVVVYGFCGNVISGRPRPCGYTDHRWVAAEGLDALAFHRVQHKIIAQLPLCGVRPAAANLS
jgi:A/G-specific adenine glycosylase